MRIALARVTVLRRRDPDKRGARVARACQGAAARCAFPSTKLDRDVGGAGVPRRAFGGESVSSASDAIACRIRAPATHRGILPEIARSNRALYTVASASNAH
jgi:hypothetical protein